MIDSPTAPTSPLVGQSSLRNAQIIKLAGGHLISQAIYVLAKLRVPDHLTPGPVNIEKLAELTETDSPTLYRILRVLAGCGLLTEDAERNFALTLLGSTLRSGAPGHIRSLVLYLAGPIAWGAIGNLLHAAETGEEAMKKAHGQSFYDLITDNAEETTAFNESMIAIHGTEPEAVARAYDFEEIKTVIDVGGGTGNLLFTLLLANQHLKGVLYDRPDVTAEARTILNEKRLVRRCDIIEGSFLEFVPKGGDAYLLSHILHNWDDETCLKILARCSEAMRGAGRLLIVEQLILPKGGWDSAKFNDLVMLALMSRGLERTQSEFAELLARSGFEITRVLSTESLSSIIEAVPA